MLFSAGSKICLTGGGIWTFGCRLWVKKGYQKTLTLLAKGKIDQNLRSLGVAFLLTQPFIGGISAFDGFTRKGLLVGTIA